MTREDKLTVIQDLTSQLSENATINLADISGLDAETTSNLRRACFKANIRFSESCEVKSCITVNLSSLVII